MLSFAAGDIDVRVVLVGVAVGALLLTLVALLVQRAGRRRRHSSSQSQKQSQSQSLDTPITVPAEPVTVAGLVPEAECGDAALMAAIAEAEAGGSVARLPELYLAVAQLRIEGGDAQAAAELLRRCIRSAASADHRETHATARVLLGDIAQAAGDPVTACEHWQIARQLFHQLGRAREFDAVDVRMLRNGCPTDWVLTDF